MILASWDVKLLIKFLYLVFAYIPFSTDDMVIAIKFCLQKQL